MMSGPVVFIDSGIGGVPYCKHFIARNPARRVVYAADREHFPYGGRSKAELESILCDLADRLVRRFKPELIVLACNTATVSALDSLRRRFPELPFVGTVPAVKPAVEQSCTRTIGVLGTERTVEDPYLWELAEKYGSGCKVTAIAAPDLVEFVETKIPGAAAEERRGVVTPYVERFRRAGADGIVLGCTHFLFLLDEFRACSAPDMRVFDSIDGICRRVEALLAADGSEGAPEIGGAFIVTGERPPEDSWRHWAGYLGLSMETL